MKIIDGKKISNDVLDEIKNHVEDRVNNRKKVPHLAAVLVGDDGPSQTYVNSKIKACERVGFKSSLFKFDDSISEGELMSQIQNINENDDIDGFIVQLPLPKHINQEKILNNVSPDKDVDGFHPSNLGRLVQGDFSGLLPCTPAGVVRMLEHSGMELVGAKAAVLGRSRIVGMPMSLMLAGKGVDATVTIVHSRTQDVESICKESDIIIAAIGRPHTIKPDWVKSGAYVVDVGISRMDDGELAGDVDPQVADVAGWITPVPGGVGPMTIAMLMENTLTAARQS